MRMLAISTLLLAALCPAAQAQTSPPATTNAGVQVRDAWARATTPSAKVGGAFATLVDTGAPDRLISVTSPVAASAELHETVNEKGVMKMLPVEHLELQPGKAVELKPGGYHIMLMGLTRQLKPGESFPMTLTFEKSPPATVTVTVGRAGASGPAMSHDMGHHAP